MIVFTAFGIRAIRVSSVFVAMLTSFAFDAGAGALTGTILDVGMAAEIADFAAIPASAGSRPLARINNLREVPDGSGRLFVNDLNGPFHVIDGATISTYADLSTITNFKTAPGLASGFVSFAFHPDFATNGIFYTVHSETIGSIPPNLSSPVSLITDQHSVLTEWTATVPSANVFAGSVRELIRVAAPHRSHNIGEIAFDPTLDSSDPDYGLLYIGAGDYGSVAVGEPENLQRLDSPLGTVMRIDPLGGSFMRGGITYDYTIPASNPFANDPDPNVLGEIYAYGFRKAHRIHWDESGSSPGPYVSDIGQGNIEEVNRLLAGANYGWPEREGTYALAVSVDPETVFALPMGDFGFTYPVAQYDHAEGIAIAGGIVKRGAAGAPLEGQFIFGDIATGRLLYADATAMLAADDGDPATTAQVYELGVVFEQQFSTLQDIVAAELGLASINRVDLRFGVDASNQIYVTTKQDGMVRTLDPLPEPGSALSLLSGALVLALFERRRANR